MAGPAPDVLSDPLLRDVPLVEGCRVLAQVALYAKVGHGGMGVVYRGRHCVLAVDMAVKVLRPSLLAEDPRFAQRFLREAQAAAHVTHQNVVRLYDASQQHGLHYLLMEFVDGENLRGRVQRRGPLQECEALGIVLGAAQGLAEAHRAGMVHRDVKPDNVLLARSGRVKLADLGLVKRFAADGASVSLESGVMGTPQYMPPEQFDTPDVTPAADVWALGACLWFLLAGEHPLAVTTLAAAARRVQEHDFPSLRARRPDVRPDVHTLLERCVRRRPDERFADARALVEALLPLAPWPEERLADPDAGSAARSDAAPTPPPRATLERIRAQLSTGTALASPEQRRSEAETVRSPGGTAATSPPPPARSSRRGRIAAAVLATLAVAAVGWGALAGWFAPAAQWDEAERIVQARARFAEAETLLPQPDTLDAVVGKLDEALALRPDFAAAKSMLALALTRRAEQTRRRDPDAAFVDARRAVELDAASADARSRYDVLENELRVRLMLGVEIRSPQRLEVVSPPRLVVSGTVPAAAKVRRVIVHATPAAATATAPGIDVPVVGGVFSTTIDVQPGELQVYVEAEDHHGVRASSSPVGVLAVGVTGGNAPLDAPSPDQTLWTLAGLPMRPVSAGTFTMGSNQVELGRADDELQHEVTLTQPFWLGMCEVTRRQWELVMGTTPWAAAAAPVADAPAAAPDAAPDDAAAGELPATHVTWADANAFCERLTELERDAGRVPDGYRYCLPTEAQWERAAHGDGYRTFVHGDDPARLARYAVFGGDTGPLPAGSRAPNERGFVDLAGNVAEWCADHALAGATSPPDTYHDAAVDPLGTDGELRIVRGGHAGSPASACRNAARAAIEPGEAGPTVGFRPALARR